MVAVIFVPGAMFPARLLYRTVLVPDGPYTATPNIISPGNWPRFLGRLQLVQLRLENGDTPLVLNRPTPAICPQECLENASSKVSSCCWYIRWFRGTIQPSDASCPQTSVYVFVTYKDTQDHTPSDPSLTEWDICWPMATWYMSWHVAICLCVVSLPSKLFKLECEHFSALGPINIFLTTFLGHQHGRSRSHSISRLEPIDHPVTLVPGGYPGRLRKARTLCCRGSWNMGARDESIHRRRSSLWASRLHIRKHSSDFDEVTAFSFSVFQGLGRCLLPAQPRSRVVLPFFPEKKSSAPSSIEPNHAAVETV